MDVCPGIVTLWLSTPSCCGMALAADPCRDPSPKGWAAGVGRVVSPLCSTSGCHTSTSGCLPPSLRNPLVSWPTSGLLRGVPG